MLYNLLLPYIHTSHIANLFHYITFRSGVAILLNLIICLTVSPLLINYLKSWQKSGQPIRNDIPVSHQVKAGTPTMGGIVVVGSITISTLILTDITNIYVLVTLFTMISFAILGFIDDYQKVVKKSNTKGVRGKTKLLIQFIISLISCTIIHYHLDPKFADSLVIPFFKKLTIDLGIFYIPFSMFVVIGSSNAVNLTDGLDGLAIMPIAIVSLCFAIVCYLAGNIFYADYLQISYITYISELTVLCSAIVGASLGFLWYNSQPAEIFMGDTGSLALGGALGIISVISKSEVVLSIIGGLFVIETLSVLIQVYYFKFSGGKRIFKMAPLHHHFEKQGWPESKVVIRFWILSVIFALIGLSTLKLR